MKFHSNQKMFFEKYFIKYSGISLKYETNFALLSAIFHGMDKNKMKFSKSLMIFPSHFSKIKVNLLDFYRIKQKIKRFYKIF